MGPGWVGRERARWISWDGFPAPAPAPQEYKNEEPGWCWQPGKQWCLLELAERPLALLHPGSLVRRGHTAPGKAGLHSISILSFGPSCQYEEKQQQSEVRLPSFERTTVRKGGLSCQVGEGSWQGEAGGQTRGCDTLDSSLPWCVVIWGMKRNWTLDQSPPRIFLPPSSSTLGPAVPSELRAAPSTVTRLSWACQDASLPLLVGRFCTKCWSHSVWFMVAPVAPVLEAHPLPVEAKPALSVATTSIYSNTAGCD